MSARNLGTQIKGLYKFESMAKGNLFVSSASSIEPIRALFLDTTRGLTTPQTLAALTTTSMAPQNNFFRIVHVCQSIVLYTIPQRSVDTIGKLKRADWEKNIIQCCHFLGLDDTLIYVYINF